MSQALCQAEKVSSLATAIRELFDASQPGEHGEVLELGAALAETVSDLLPVAESAEVQVCNVPGPACPVRFDAARLRQGLFHLIGFVIGSGAPGAVVKIELEARGAEAMLALTVSRESVGERPPDSISDRELLRRLGLGIARAIFVAKSRRYWLCCEASRAALNRSRLEKTRLSTFRLSGVAVPALFAVPRLAGSPPVNDRG